MEWAILCSRLLVIVASGYLLCFRFRDQHRHLIVDHVAPVKGLFGITVLSLEREWSKLRRETLGSLSTLASVEGVEALP